MHVAASIGVMIGVDGWTKKIMCFKVWFAVLFFHFFFFIYLTCIEQSETQKCRLLELFTIGNNSVNTVYVCICFNTVVYVPCIFAMQTKTWDTLACLYQPATWLMALVIRLFAFHAVLLISETVHYSDRSIVSKRRQQARASDLEYSCYLHISKPLGLRGY